MSFGGRWLGTFAVVLSARWIPACAGMAASFVVSVGSAQTVAGDTFADAANGAKAHVASGFVCPAKIGSFERDAVGEADAQTGADFCAYSALDGLYGTIRLVPLRTAYDPKQSLADDFAEQEDTGGKQIAEVAVAIPAAPHAASLPVYSRTYETAKLEDLHYRVEFTGAAIGNWAVETTLEFAEPRDVAQTRDFLHAVYAAAEREIGQRP